MTAAIKDQLLPDYTRDDLEIAAKNLGITVPDVQKLVEVMEAQSVPRLRDELAMIRLCHDWSLTVPQAARQAGTNHIRLKDQIKNKFGGLAEMRRQRLLEQRGKW